MNMNNETKLVFALEHTAHLSDLIEGNEYEHHLRDALSTLDFEFKRQLKLERNRKENIKWVNNYSETPP